MRRDFVWRLRFWERFRLWPSLWVLCGCRCVGASILRRYCVPQLRAESPVQLQQPAVFVSGGTKVTNALEHPCDACHAIQACITKHACMQPCKRVLVPSPGGGECCPRVCALALVVARVRTRECASACGVTGGHLPARRDVSPGNAFRPAR